MPPPARPLWERMKTLTGATVELKEGRLIIDGTLIPLSKGSIFLALLKAGWRGAEGLLSAELVDRILVIDPRIGALVRHAG